MNTTSTAQEESTGIYEQVERVAIVGIDKSTWAKVLPAFHLQEIFPNANKGSIAPVLPGAHLEHLKLFFGKNTLQYDLILATTEAIEKVQQAIEKTISSEASVVELPALPNPADSFDFENNFDKDVADAIDEILTRVQTALTKIG